MYRIYMPVDMVLAITHSKMRRERIDRLYKDRIESERLAAAMKMAATVTTTSYEKHDERESREKLDNSLKNNNCIEMFRFW
jgi:hypothetical protein